MTGTQVTVSVDAIIAIIPPFKILQATVFPSSINLMLRTLQKSIVPNSAG